MKGLNNFGWIFILEATYFKICKYQPLFDPERTKKNYAILEQIAVLRSERYLDENFPTIDLRVI